VTIFGPTLDKLTVADLGAFFSDAPSEALEWEAKSELNAGSIRKQVCGFANSHDGGYLVLGIQDPKQGGTWGLEGGGLLGIVPRLGRRAAPQKRSHPRLSGVTEAALRELIAEGETDLVAYDPGITVSAGESDARRRAQLNRSIGTHPWYPHGTDPLGQYRESTKSL
jgi:predicted HTH transcriptional regulator